MDIIPGKRAPKLFGQPFDHQIWWLAAENKLFSVFVKIGSILCGEVNSLTNKLLLGQFNNYVQFVLAFSKLS